MPGLTRLLLVHLLSLCLVWGGAICFAALQQAPGWRGLRDPRALEAVLSIAAGVAVGDRANSLGPMLLPLLAATWILGSLLILPVVLMPRGPVARHWLACAWLASFASSFALAIVAAVPLLDPAALAWWLGPGCTACASLAVVLMTWFPLQAISSGTVLVLLSANRLAAAGHDVVASRDRIGWALFATAALLAVAAGLVLGNVTVVGLVLVLAGLCPAAWRRLRRTT